MSILELLKPKRTSVLDLLEEEKPTFASRVSEGVMNVAKAPFKAAQDILKFQEPYMKAGFAPKEKVEETIGAGLKAMPSNVRDLLIPTLMPKQFPIARKIEQEYIQDELFKFVASAPVNPLVLGTVAAEILTPAIGKPTLSQRLARQMETRQPKFDWKNVDEINVNREILKTAERVPIFEKTKFVGQVKDFLSKTVKTINSPSTSNNLKWQLYNRYFKAEALQESLLGKPQLPSLISERGAISIPSGKDLTNLAKQFNLTQPQIEAIQKGIYTGLSGEVINAIKGIKPSILKPAEKAPVSVGQPTGEGKVVPQGLESLAVEARNAKTPEEFALTFVKPGDPTYKISPKKLLQDLKDLSKRQANQKYSEEDITREQINTYFNKAVQGRTGGAFAEQVRNTFKPLETLESDDLNRAIGKQELPKSGKIKVYRGFSGTGSDELRVGDFVSTLKSEAKKYTRGVGEIKEYIVDIKDLSADNTGRNAFREMAYTPGGKLPEVNETKMDYIDFYNKAKGISTPTGGKPALISKGLTETSQSFDPINETVISGKSEVIKPQIRRQIKRITGITKVGEVIQITDRIALRDKLRLEARAAKKGEVRGRIEQQIKEIEKRKIDSVEQALIDETNDIVKNINRMPTHNMDIGYKDTIEGIKKQFDLKTRSSKTLIRREKLKQFIDQQKLKGQPVNIPIEQIEMAYKTPLNELMIDELREINSTIKKLSYIGRTKSRLIEIRQDKNFQGVKSELIDTLHIKPMSESAVDIVRKTSPLEKIKAGKNTYLYSTIRPERLIEKLDGYQPFGSFWKTFYAPIDKSTNEEITNFNAKRNQFLQFVTDNDIDLVGLLDRQQEIIPKELYLTGQTKIGIYLASHDEDQMRHLMQGGIDIDGKIFDFTPEMLQATIQSLTPGEKSVGDYLLNHYEEQYSGIDKVYTELYGEHLPKIEGYSPIRISGEEKVFEESLADEMLRRARMRRLGIEKGFTKERVKGAQQAVKLDAIDGFLFNLQRVEHFKAFAPTIQDIRKVLYDEDIRSAIYSKRGKEFYKKLDNWVKDVANKTEGKDFSPLSKQFSILRSNSAISVLGWNLITAMKQPLSLSIAIAEAGLTPVLSGMAQVTLHPKKVSEFVNERDPQIKYRRVERDIREMIEQQGIVKTLKGVAGPKSLKFLMAMDRRTVLAIWKGVYDQEFKKTNDEAQAIKKASQVIRKTQPQSYTKDLAEYFRGGELERMFTMFQNQVNQNMNYWEHDMLGKLLTKGTGVGPASFAIKWWWSYLLPAYVIGMVSRGRKPTQDELKVDLATYALMGLPFFGPLIASGLRGYGGVSLPLQVIEYGTDLIKAKKLATKLNILIKVGFAVKGIPHTQPMRVIKGIAKFDEYGVKGLIYGPRKEKKKKETILDLLR